MGILERRERELKKREEDILAAALSLMDRDDWQTVTIDQIAARAEIGKGTVYKHFESKDQIYARLVSGFFLRLLAQMKGLDVSKPVRKVLEEAMTVFWRFHQASPEYIRLIRYCRREDFRQIVGEESRRELEALDAEFLSWMAPLIERGIREGVIVKKPVERVIIGIHAAMIGVLEMSGVECGMTNLTKEEIFKEVVEFVLRGVAPKGKRA